MCLKNSAVYQTYVTCSETYYLTSDLCFEFHSYTVCVHQWKLALLQCNYLEKCIKIYETLDLYVTAEESRIHLYVKTKLFSCTFLCIRFWIYCVPNSALGVSPSVAFYATQYNLSIKYQQTSMSIIYHEVWSSPAWCRVIVIMYKILMSGWIWWHQVPVYMHRDHHCVIKINVHPTVCRLQCSGFLAILGVTDLQRDWTSGR